MQSGVDPGFSEPARTKHGPRSESHTKSFDLERKSRLTRRILFKQLCDTLRLLASRDVHAYNPLINIFMNDSLNTERMTTPEKKHDLLSELIRFALITLFIVLPIRIYIAQPFIVSGSSMDPTFKDGEYLIIDEISYRFQDPERGDVIVFRYPQDTTKFFIKRIIGLPGETVNIKDSTITIEGTSDTSTFTLDETYLSHPTWSTSRIKLGDEEYFVMGDNRPASSDSRIWGALDEDLIIGRALVRLLPAKRIGIFPGEHTYSEANVATTQ